MFGMARVPHFFYHPRMTGYDFGKGHPLNPERLRRTMLLLDSVADVDWQDPGLATREQIEMVHAPEYVACVAQIQETGSSPVSRHFGLGTQDTPAFSGILDASLAYCGGSIRAAEAVRDGASLAFNIAGGLHHAQRAFASGFCVFNDPALAIEVLKERFDRIVYVDIDVHHGDGVQAIYEHDPKVLTCSIHQMARGFYPGTGRVEESSVDYSAVNVPLPPETTGDTWLWAFREGILPVIERFQPQALVLQLGTDAHFSDPLARLLVTAQEWREAVADLAKFGLPTVALGGGGYNLQSVPRMWVGAVLVLSGLPVPELVPAPFGELWGMPRFDDLDLAHPRLSGMDFALRVVQTIRNLHLA